MGVICHHSDSITEVISMGLNVTAVDGVKIRQSHPASCHCGAVRMQLSLPHGLVDVRRCDCSMCRRRGAIVASVPLANIKITDGEDSLRLYQFNTQTARHYFCSNCGIYTHHQRRSNPSQYGFNVACLEGINPLKLPDVPTYDGVNHPADYCQHSQPRDKSR